METSARICKGEVGASERGLERRWGLQREDGTAVRRTGARGRGRSSEGSQGSSERDEEWRLVEGTRLDSRPSSEFGSGLEVPAKGRLWGATLPYSGVLGLVWSTWAKGLFSWAFSCSKNLSSPWALTMRSDSSEKSTASPSKATRS